MLNSKASRRKILKTLAGVGAAGVMGFPTYLRAADAAKPKMAAFKLVTSGLQAPEGPKAQADGSVLVCEMARGTLSRVSAKGEITVVGNLHGSPNGCAVGPDSAAYVTNNGGSVYHREGDLLISDPPETRVPAGTIQRVDLKTGAFTNIYTTMNGLAGANDIAFDQWGTFWFTDPPRNTVWWAKTDGSQMFPVATVNGANANGIAFSPDGKRLYFVSSRAGQILALDVNGPGQIARRADGTPVVTTVADFTDKTRFDSMAVEADGTLVVGTLSEGCLTLLTPEGKLRDKVFLPDMFVTNVSFGGPNLRTAYVTLTRTGKLVAVEWPRPGLKLVNYGPA